MEGSEQGIASSWNGAWILTILCNDIDDRESDL